jgi:MFS transporter, PAT family, beta-lactamase induction signal transducer AmpG
MSASSRQRTPWIYIPSTYFAEGLPYVLVNTTSVVLYKNLGISNKWIALTSILYLPWVIKMLWSPLVDVTSTKRRWLYRSQFLFALILLLLALVLWSPVAFWGSLVLFLALAFVSATHDIATDGFYMLSLSSQKQALFVGIRATAYRLAMLLGSGGLILLAGLLQSGALGPSSASSSAPSTPDLPTLLDPLAFLFHQISLLQAVLQSWSWVFVAVALLFLVLALFHRWYLPFPSSDQPRRLSPPTSQESTPTSQQENAEPLHGFLSASWTTEPPQTSLQHLFAPFRSFFGHPAIGRILAFVLFYRLGEALLLKMVPPFLLDPPGRGGLGLSTASVGLVYGTAGLLSLIFGGIAGGAAISRFGWRRCLWPMVLLMNLPNLFYVYLALEKPPLLFVYLLLSLEQFGYGMGFSIYTVLLMFLCRGPYQTSHFAIATGMMALGMMVPGLVSGLLQAAWGYLGFFTFSCLATIPGMLAVLFLPPLDD